MSLVLQFFLLIGIIFPLYHMINIFIYFHQNKKTSLKLNKTRPISILIPCYNEALVINHTIDGLLRMDYKNYECILINDGSTDDTIKVLKNKLKLNKSKRKIINSLKTTLIKNIYQSKKYPNFYVIDKKNGGKSSALNAGINLAKNPYVVTLDADSILKKDALAIVSTAFNDKNVVAVSGVIQILQSFNLNKNDAYTNLNINWLLKLQTLEYMKSCFCYKTSLASIKSLIVISGAFGAFKKSLLLEIGGFRNVVGEDLDLTLNIQFLLFNQKKKKICYCLDAICYTEGPETLKDYFKQRKRWQQSFIGCLILFRKQIYKYIFSRTLCFFMVVDALILGIISAFIISFFSILIIQNILYGGWTNIIVYLIIFVIVNLMYNVSGIAVAYIYGIKYKGKDKLRLLYTIMLDIVIYRIIIVCTIIYGTLSYFWDNHNWNKVNRSGRNYNVLKN